MTGKELLEKYGDVKLQFSSYYKYSFVFKGGGLTVYAGGDKDDIYRFSVSPNTDYVLKDLPICRVYNEKEECIYEE